MEHKIKYDRRRFLSVAALTFALMLALSFGISANAQALSPVEGIRSSKQLMSGGLLFMPITKQVFPPLVDFRNKQEDFVYFPFSESLGTSQYPAISETSSPKALFAVEKENYNDKAALYKQQLKLSGKLVFKGTIEIIPCNDLGYFIPEPIARNY
ncbi:hypothetical protein [Olivibacter domesticus]|uniref:Gluconate 2-dehydrogenase subunit 3 n=1 Tax=Olivibacter domesticus TaxID=407022 RepID=A0A1H7GL22_OLID1|nr:hypothetical protein [Olivibacter domesticus]SEK37230.1 hypothetical protein SAMN05661044_00078 [Olivibacter domesticus]